MFVAVAFMWKVAVLPTTVYLSKYVRWDSYLGYLTCCTVCQQGLLHSSLYWPSDGYGQATFMGRLSQFARNIVENQTACRWWHIPWICCWCWYTCNTITLFALWLFSNIMCLVRSTLLSSLTVTSCSLSPRLTKVESNLEGRHTAMLFSCYALTLAAPQEEKDNFYDKLNDAVRVVPFKHKVFVLGDFNAGVGSDHEIWHIVIGPHGIRNMNAKCQWVPATAAVCGTRTGCVSADQQTQSQLTVQSTGTW